MTRAAQVELRSANECEPLPDDAVASRMPSGVHEHDMTLAVCPSSVIS